MPPTLSPDRWDAIESPGDDSAYVLAIRKVRPRLGSHPGSPQAAVAVGTEACLLAKPKMGGGACTARTIMPPAVLAATHIHHHHHHHLESLPCNVTTALHLSDPDPGAGPSPGSIPGHHSPGIHV